MSVSKSWRFTLNHPTEAEKAAIRLWEVSRCAVTEEVGAEGTPHMQGFITFPRAMRLAGLKKLAPRAHWEVSKTKDWNYELKTDSVQFRVEDNRQQGRRTDVDEVYEAVAAAASPDKFLECRPNLSQIKLFEKLQSMKGSRPIGPIEVLWFYGGTGTGKTRRAYELYPDLYRPLSFKWWDGYVGQETVLIDDFRRDWCKFHELLTLLDVYPFRVEIKGGSTQMLAKRFVITSPFHPAETYETREDVGQLLRRITKVVEFTEAPQAEVRPVGHSPIGSEKGEAQSGHGFWYF